jgi:hypothetical protein
MRYDDDDPFDANGMLKDGRTARISMQMRDAALADRRKVVTRRNAKGGEEGTWEEEEEDDIHDALCDNARRGASFLHDGHGNDVGHRPGFLLRADIASEQRRRAYDAYRHDLENAWRHPPTRDGPRSWEDRRRDAEGYSERDIGGVCTVKNEDYPDDFGSPGHIRRVGRKIICVPDRRKQPDPASDRRSVEQRVADHQRTMADEYRRYDESMTNAWRNP